MKPVVLEEVAPLRQAIADARRAGKSIGLVPTMGALHAGHISLLEAARRETDFVVCSIFVNPIQFGPNEDLQRYPRTFQADLEACEQQETAIVFFPSVETMYPPGFRTYVEVAEWKDLLCGQSRPIHFRGVTTVVMKLFQQVQPDKAYFGQKDGQQARIIEQMVRDLDVPVTIRVMPIIREPDGLAMSSRNKYLDSTQRKNATVLSRALHEVRAKIEAGERDAKVLRQHLLDRIGGTEGVVVDYAEVVSYETLEKVDQLEGRTLIAVAAYLGETRLIDNILVDS